MSIKPPPAGRAKVWTPFWRRFTDQRATDLQDTIAFHAQVRRAFKASDWADPNMIAGATEYYFRALNNFKPVPPYIEGRIKTAIRGVLELETHIFQHPDIDCGQLNLKEQVELRRFLRAQQRFLNNQDHFLSLLANIVLSSFAAVIEGLPTLPSGNSTLTVSLLDALQLPAGVIAGRITAVLMSDDLEDSDLFQQLRERLYLNACQASGVWPYEKPTKQVIPASKSDLPPKELFETYLAGTPFQGLLDMELPFAILRKIWASHGIILAPPNFGKSQILQTFIYGFLQEKDPVGCFVLDPHGDVYATLVTRVDRERLICLDPDISPPPLNFLDFGTSTLPQIEATFGYLMSSLAGGLSDVQEGCIPYLLKLLKEIPDCNLQTLRQILSERPKSWEKSGFIEYIRQIPKDDQIYFEHEFFHHTLDATKHSIARKISHAMASDTFKRMFGAKTNSVNFDKWIDERKVVVVKGGFGSLGEEGMRVFLQFLVAQYYAAGMRRISRVPESQRHLCIMFIDEASYVLTSPLIARILFELRKAGCALVTATQVWEQIGTEVKAAVLGGTAIKAAGSIQANDANVLAREMYCTPDFIRSMASEEYVGAEWAIHVSPAKKTMKVWCPFGTLEKMPERLSDEQLMDMFVQAKVDEAKQKPIMPQTTPEQDEEIVQAMIEALDDDMKTHETQQSDSPTEKPEGAPPTSEIKPGKKVW